MGIHTWKCQTPFYPTSANSLISRLALIIIRPPMFSMQSEPLILEAPTPLIFLGPGLGTVNVDERPRTLPIRAHPKEDSG